MQNRIDSEFQKLREMGWDDSPKDYTHKDSQTDNLSYPQTGFNFLNSDTSQGYWFRHRARTAASILLEEGVGLVWDVGAGTGVMAELLAERGIDAISVEPHEEGARQMSKKGLVLFQSSLQDLALPNSSISAITLFDVIEHLENPSEVLAEVRRVLRKGGRCLVTVPAHPFLWSNEDVMSGHQRRYKKMTLVTQLEQSGFEVLSVRYFFLPLVPLAWFMRALPYKLGLGRIEKKVAGSAAELLKPNRFLNSLATCLLGLESRLSRRIPIPFGLSLVALVEPKF